MEQPVLKRIPVSRISPSPFQPRESFQKDLLAELADSMKHADILQPIIVRRQGDGYQIAAGERRWRAAQMAGWEEILAIVREMDDRTMQLYSLIENLHRLDLDSHEKERAVYDLWEKHYKPQDRSRADLASDLGLDSSTVNHLIASYEDRVKIREEAVKRTATTTDLHVTRGLDETIREDLLRRKTRGELAQKDLEDIATVAKGAPIEKQRAITEEMLRETKKARDLVEIAKEEAQEFARGELQRTEIRLGPDQNRLRRIGDLYKDVRSHFSVANLEMIRNDPLRHQAVEFLRRVRDHCDALLRQLEGRDWYRE